MPVLPSLQLRQRPHAMLNGTETMSPFWMKATSRPASITSPVISWPRISPAGAGQENCRFRDVVVVTFKTREGPLQTGCGGIGRAARTPDLPNRDRQPTYPLADVLERRRPEAEADRVMRHLPCSIRPVAVRA